MRSHGLEGFRYGGLSLYLTRALDHRFHFVEIAARFLNRDDVGMVGEFDHNFGGDVVSRGLRKVVDDDGQRGAVGNRAIESQQVRRQHLLLVVVRSAHHGSVVPELGSILGEPQSFLRGLDSGACDHDFIGSGSGERGLQNVTAFLVGEQDGFAGRALDHYTRNRRARVALDVRFDLFVIDLAVWIERRRDGRKDSG